MYSILNSQVKNKIAIFLLQQLQNAMDGHKTRAAGLHQCVIPSIGYQCRNMMLIL